MDNGGLAVANPLIQPLVFVLESCVSVDIDVKETPEVGTVDQATSNDDEDERTLILLAGHQAGD